MSGLETAEQIGRDRRVSAKALLEGRADLSEYPFGYLAVTGDSGSGFDSVSWVLHAVEYLRQFGWSLVTVSRATPLNVPFAVLQRELASDAATAGLGERRDSI